MPLIPTYVAIPEVDSKTQEEANEIDEHCNN